MVRNATAPGRQNVDGFIFRKKRSGKSKRKALAAAIEEPTKGSPSSLQSEPSSANLSTAMGTNMEASNSSSSSAARLAKQPSSSRPYTGSHSKRARLSSYKSKITLEESGIAAAVPRHPVVNPQPRIRNVDRSDPVKALCQLAKNLVECEENAMKRQYVGMNAYISEWSSTCCKEFLDVVEKRMSNKRSNLLAPSMVVLPNPDNLRLQSQRKQLEQLLRRLQGEVAMWEAQIEASNKREAEHVSARGTLAKEANGEHMDEENQHQQQQQTSLERMSSKIMRMAVQVEKIQHALEQSKRSVVTSVTKRILLSSHVHEVAQFSVKPPTDMIRGFLKH